MKKRPDMAQFTSKISELIHDFEDPFQIPMALIIENVVHT